MVLYQQTQNQIYASAIDDVMFIVTLMSIVAVGLALLLPSGRPAPAGSAAAPQSATERPAPAPEPTSSGDGARPDGTRPEVSEPEPARPRTESVVRP
jgi:hypothetical protein